MIRCGFCHSIDGQPIHETKECRLNLLRKAPAQIDNWPPGSARTDKSGCRSNPCRNVRRAECQPNPTAEWASRLSGRSGTLAPYSYANIAQFFCAGEPYLTISILRGACSQIGNHPWQ